MKRPIPWLPLLLTAVALAAAAWPPLTEALLYDRDLVAQGQWWRPLSANLVHLTWGHTLLNLGGLVLVWLLFGPRLSQRAWSLAWLTSAMTVGAAIHLLNPEVNRYVGLSGVLHGLFVAGALSEAGSDRRWGLGLLTVVTGKLAYEQLLGPLPGSEASAGGPVLVDAHLYGALGGIPLGLWGFWQNRRQSSSVD